MKAKEFLILILIILAGVLIFHIHTGRIDMDWDWEDGLFFAENEFIYQESQEIPPPYPDSFHIINSHGSIEITGTEEEKITIALEKKIWRNNEEDAFQVAEQLGIQTDSSRDRIVITTNRRDFRRKNFRTNFKIGIPQAMGVDVKNEYGQVMIRNVRTANVYNNHGRVDAAEITGRVVIKNTHNDVTVDKLESQCQIESSYSTIRASDVQGEVEISHRYGKIHLDGVKDKVTVDSEHAEVLAQNMSGPVEIENSYRKISLQDVRQVKIATKNTTVEIEKAKGDIHIINDHGRIRLSDIEGSLDISGSSTGLYGERITGDTIAVSASYRDIELTDFQAETQINSDHNRVILKPLPLTSPIQVKGKYTDIEFFWPPEKQYPIEAKVRGGDILWEVPFPPSQKDENGTTVIRAFENMASLVQIFLSTEYATIKIKQ